MSEGHELMALTEMNAGDGRTFDMFGCSCGTVFGLRPRTGHEDEDRRIEQWMLDQHIEQISSPPTT